MWDWYASIGERLNSVAGADRMGSRCAVGVHNQQVMVCRKG